MPIPPKPSRGILAESWGGWQSNAGDWRKPARHLISPSAGEMSGRTERGVKERCLGACTMSHQGASQDMAATPAGQHPPLPCRAFVARKPSNWLPARYADRSSTPARGEIGSFGGGADPRNLGKCLLPAVNQLDAAHALR
ncbi:MAG: hypothetical protein EOR68_32905 [Mesorhizobium sp.]|nr:MAG: hypothetical protein EOR68_32905 [Mesorhizobium sp.]TIP43326.1 MAG: hypothetical protein E5X77_22595 [Mesorhizobium sp.]